MRAGWLFPPQWSRRDTPVVNVHRARAQAETPSRVVGILLIGGFAAQAIWGWRWSWLAGLQEEEVYKQITGLVLVLFFVMQWRLSLARMQPGGRPVAALLAEHRARAVIGPLLLYLHAISFGHAYVRVMSLAFLGLMALGFLQQSITRLRRGWMSTGWLVAHVALAAMLVFLISYHAFNAFYYE